MDRFGLTPQQQAKYGFPPSNTQPTAQQHQQQQRHPPQQGQPSQQYGQTSQQRGHPLQQQMQPIIDQQAPQQFHGYANHPSYQDEMQQYSQPATSAQSYNAQPANQQQQAASQQQLQQQQGGWQQMMNGQQSNTHYTEETTRKVTTTSMQQQAHQHAQQQHQGQQYVQQQAAQQPIIDYSHLKQQAPPTPPPLEDKFFRMAISPPPLKEPKPEPKAIASSSKQVSRAEDNDSRMQGSASQFGTNTNQTTTTRTTKTTKVTGGQRRQEAASHGQERLARFDREISQMLMTYSGAICPAGYGYSPCRQGYLCHGGSHLVTHAEVEAMLEGMRPLGPLIEEVNVIDEVQFMMGGRTFKVVTPPPIPRNCPMNWPWRMRVAFGADPMPKNCDGGRFCYRIQGYHEGECDCRPRRR